MNVALLGLPYFTRKLAAELADAQHDDRYLSLDLNYHPWDRVRYVVELPRTDVVHVIGGTLNRSGSISLALHARKPVILHWVGTDVLRATESVANGTARVEMAGACVHFCECEWIRNELAELGIQSRVLPIASFPDTLPEPAGLPSDFRVLSYVSPGREVFYGIDWLIRLAAEMPRVQVRVTGIGSWPAPVPENLKLLAHVPDMNAEMDGAVLFLRLAEHDGLSFSVLEALARGRYVAYRYPHPHSHVVRSADELVATVRSMHAMWMRGGLEPNRSGHAFIRENYLRSRVLGGLRKEYRAAAEIS